MTRKPAWQRKRTWLGMSFTAVTIAYIAYRLIMAGGYNGVGALLLKPEQPLDIGCSTSQQHNHKKPIDRAPSNSTAYQKFIARQPAASPNLIPNADLSRMVAASGEPKNFYRTLENKNIQYQAFAGKQHSDRFLRVTNIPTETSQEKGTWVSELIPIARDASYRYAFEYRTATPLEVTIEYLSTKDSRAYETVAVLEKNSNWQQFTGYVGNNRDALAFRFVVAPLGSGQLDMRGFAAYQLAPSSASTGMVTISFDDGWQSIKDNAIPLLDKYGFKTTQYVISEAAQENIKEYMDIGTLQHLKKEGHEIGSHSSLHCDQTTLDILTVTSDAARSREILERHQLGPIKSFAYPYGAHSVDTDDVYAKHYPLVRTSDEGYNDAYFDAQNIRSYAVLDTTPPELVQSWLDHAARHKLWVVLVYHHVGKTGMYNVTEEQLDEQLRLIKKSGLPVLTLSEAAQKIRP